MRHFRVPTFVCDWRTVPTTKTVRFHWANTREKQSSFAEDTGPGEEGASIVERA